MTPSLERPHDEVAGPQFEPDPVLAAEMSELASAYVDRAKKSDVVLDYSDASVDAADGIGLQLYEALPRGRPSVPLEELRSGLASELGAYFGETFIRNHGGQWGWVAATGNQMFGLRTNAGLSAFPIPKARKRLQGAEHDSLAVVYGFLTGWQEKQTRRRSSGR